MVASKQVAGRRELQFSKLSDVLEDAREVTQGNPRVLGNWSPGQIMMHLARAMDASIDGVEWKMSWIKRLIGQYLFKRKILEGGMPAGYQLPAPVAERLVASETTTEAGLMALESAIQRLEGTSERKPHGFFGPMDADEWTQLHLRHAELHLSFILAQ